MPKPEPTEALDSLLREAETEIAREKTASTEADRAILREIETLESGKATVELEIERDILKSEMNLTLKIEAELWNGAHIACLPYFYETYTVQARIEAGLQKKYNQATIAACSRFKALGKNGLAMVTPVIDFIRNYADFTPEDRKNLDKTLMERILTWLREDIVPESKPRTLIVRSLDDILADVVEAEQVFQRSPAEAVYLQGEARMASLKAIRSSGFLPNLVKIRLLEAIPQMKPEEIADIATFLLWEIRKSSQNRHMLLHTMLQILRSLNKSLA